MLVLSRHKNQVVHIAGGKANGGVDICVVEIRGDKVRLGFDADPGITIHRAEVTDAIERDRRIGRAEY